MGAAQCGFLGAGCKDYRSDVGGMGIHGSMQVTFNKRAGAGFVDIDRFSPFQNARGFIGHFFGEVLFSNHGSVVSFPQSEYLNRARMSQRRR